MKYRPLGKTGLQVSEIGFGAWGIGGSLNGDIAYGPTVPTESISALQRATELGINFFDTSDFYGFGYSESIIGEALADVRQSIVIATKVGMLYAAGKYDFSAGHMKRALEASLRRLRTDYIDLYQLHSPPINLLSEADHIIPLLESFVSEGKIRAYGISVQSPQDGLVAVRDYGFKAVQANFNMIDQRVLKCGLMALCEERGVGIIARTPLCFGFLTGKYRGDEEFHPLDHRSKWSPEQIRCWAEAFELFIDQIALGYTRTHAHVALQYCLSHSAIATAIPGMLTVAQVEENARAGGFGPLAIAERDAIESIYNDYSFFIRKNSTHKTDA